MKKHLITLMTSAAILACGAIAASAQQTPGTEGPGTQQNPATQQTQQQPAQQGASQQRTPESQKTPGGSALQQQAQQTFEDRMRERWRRAQRDDDEEDGDRDEYRGYGGRMMGPYGHGMMGGQDGWRDRRGGQRGGAGLGGPLGRVLFALMDTNGDGKISLQEWQAAHERIFKAMDTDNDGTVDLQEMQQFIRPARRPGPRQQN